MRLTHAEEAMAAAVEDQWLAAALETEAADRAAAEDGVRQAYRLAGAEAPDRMYWFGSPRAGAAAAALLTGADVPGPDAPRWFAEAHDELRRQGWVPGERAGASLRRRVRTEPWATARNAAAAELGADGWAQLGSAAGRRAWALAMELVAGRLRTRLGEDVVADLPGEAGRAVRSRMLDAVYGQFDGAWLSTFDAADRLCPQAGLMTGLAGLAAVARTAGWWWPGERAAVLTERPRLVTRDNVGRLHRGEGAALEYPDGYGLWAWRGMPIPAQLATELPTLTVERIRTEENAEIRRVMLEHYGYDRYLRDAGARKLGSDATGTLWFLDLPGDEPLVMVEVVNATPEPDGTSRIYWLRVPPSTRTAREGVAWTFGLTEAEYHPLVQT
ncbi:DUF6745 domain-containing protein [Actinoplanes sp. DH11]|uniref:DUF6745 domain-containing protein n=1 Tax=Actinoplanes sp. DH11 TaxID=2857011 RepID=UPI001E443254|nr:hypothetical protein [Actinoplanes sp. DH11]